MVSGGERGGKEFIVVWGGERGGKGFIVVWGGERGGEGFRVVGFHLGRGERREGVPSGRILSGEGREEGRGLEW